MFNFPSLNDIALMLPAIVLGLTFHEYAHGWTADRLGDRTARYQGRLTINPVAHIDPIGLLLLFFAGFGWAKPVPVNPYNLKVDQRQGMLLVALAGPVMNMLLAVISAIVFGALVGLNLPYFREIMQYMIQINVVLAVFNIIPIPPLDGSKILAGILPGRQEWLYQLEQYGSIVLILLVFTGLIGIVFKILVNPIYSLLGALARAVSRLVM
ncbi:MAG: Peptidase family M50 [Pelotomaculum sp. PtaB.Bin013]|uniref:Site-2 protease family protein n=1 Tax=Pelotomaculum isophthalicicum JI TaxID=947010 RepID=A0A9X4GZN5_9FIRM|nr:site-2 protease family protein [Pelotomaculum isophthalicicum]MDF9408975.1 site-2 protease family protein [Pelotomaculum isophthalicicum JI]OPX83888.1 MAG: Peptidase family M50 [Pelotomaculum sp. PtaB.Bin013]